MLYLALSCIVCIGVHHTSLLYGPHQRAKIKNSFFIRFPHFLWCIHRRSVLDLIMFTLYFTTLRCMLQQDVSRYEYYIQEIFDCNLILDRIFLKHFVTISITSVAFGAFVARYHRCFLKIFPIYHQIIVNIIIHAGNLAIFYSTWNKLKHNLFSPYILMI